MYWCVLMRVHGPLLCGLARINAAMPEPDHAPEYAGFHFIKLLLQLPLNTDSELFHPLLG